MNKRKRAALKILRAMVEENVIVFGEPEPGIDYTTIKEAQHIDYPFLVRIRNDGVWCYLDEEEAILPGGHTYHSDYPWPRSAHERMELLTRIDAELEASA